MDGCPPLFGPGFDADPYPVLLAVLAPRGSADLIAELAYPLPIAIICDLLGVPEADRADFHRFASVIDSAEASAVEEVRPGATLQRAYRAEVALVEGQHSPGAQPRAARTRFRSDRAG